MRSSPPRSDSKLNSTLRCRGWLRRTTSCLRSLATLISRWDYSARISFKTRLRTKSLQLNKNKRKGSKSLESNRWSWSNRLGGAFKTRPNRVSPVKESVSMPGVPFRTTSSKMRRRRHTVITNWWSGTRRGSLRRPSETACESKGTDLMKTRN